MYTMRTRREAGKAKSQRFTRIGISLRNCEIAALDKIAARLDTSRSGAIGECIMHATALAVWPLKPVKLPRSKT